MMSKRFYKKKLQTRIVGMFKIQDEYNLSLGQACIGPGKPIAVF